MDGRNFDTPLLHFLSRLFQQGPKKKADSAIVAFDDGWLTASLGRFQIGAIPSHHLDPNVSSIWLLLILLPLM